MHEATVLIDLSAASFSPVLKVSKRGMLIEEMRLIQGRGLLKNSNISSLTFIYWSHL